MENQTASIVPNVVYLDLCESECIRIKAIRQEGFSLIELSLVLLIVGILTAGGLRVFSTAKDQQAYQRTDQSLTEISEALVAHYLQFGRLPCPDTDNQTDSPSYGKEKPEQPTGVCSSNQGWLPHLTLGVGAEGDAWGNRYRYLVHPLLTELPEVPVQICTQSTRSDTNDNIIIHSAENTSKTLAEWSGFVIISTGKNGRQTNAGISSTQGAFASSGGCSRLSIQEQENCNVGTVVNAGAVLSDRQTITFDDRLVWLSDLQLTARVRKAGLCN